ncbi:MAG TPA: type III-B CRISPR module RAMP protein Cmr4 [Tepidisphaeraceae bacterium]|nr:type III-B CRISPR module RAMP protein Cmr4 [Tepidisphaeraceae bacterium]
MTETPTVADTKQSQQEAAVLFIHAQTPLHPGSGTALGTVDLPVQRERHTQWPVIPGSTLKGILRDACRRAGSNDDLFAAFGPETAEADKHAGALTLTDARILAFPVRSLKGIFAWVTCLAVLERLKRDLSLVQANGSAFNPPSGPAKDKALCPANSPLLVDGNKLVLEEFDFERSGDAEAVADWLSQRVVADDATRKRLQSHLVVLHDDDFTHFVRHATEVVARIALDYERKTVKGTALFYEEFLPAETLFYSVVLASASRRDGHGKRAGEILQYLRNNMPPVLQIGGDETIGKGLCAVRLSSREEGES